MSYLTFKRKLAEQAEMLAILEKNGKVLEQHMGDNKAYFLSPALRVNELLLAAKGTQASIGILSNAIFALFSNRIFMHKEKKEFTETINVLTEQSVKLVNTLTELLEEANRFEKRKGEEMIYRQYAKNSLLKTL